MGNLFDDASSTRSILTIFAKKIKLIATVVLSCTLLAGIATCFMKPRYSSRASFFVPYNTSLENSLENPQLGYDIEVDRMLQLINSTQFSDSVCQKFNLASYFKVDTANKQWKDNLNGIFHKRIRAGRTNAMSIYIEAETKEPEFSAELVNYMVALTQRFRERFFKTNSQIAARSFREEFLKKSIETDSLRRKILSIRTQLKSSGGVMISNNPILSETPKNNPIASDQQLDLEILTQRYIFENKNLQALKEKYEFAQNVGNRPISKIYIVDNAVPVYRPVHPVLNFNLLAAFFGSLLFMLTSIYAQHLYKMFFKNLPARD